MSVLIVPGFLDEPSCANLAAAMDRGESVPAEIQHGEFLAAPTIRGCFDVQVAPSVLDEAALRLAPAERLVREAFGLPPLRFEGVGLLRYPPGGRYRRHVDVIEGGEEPWPRRIALVVFLGSAGPGSAFEGGTLRIYERGAGGAEWVDVRPERGTLVAFAASTPHEVLPVVSGSRDVLVDWLG
jgi:predicted 2-oxoglutarate/Fe(II)-dependent dioxygenase YbiX